MDKKKEFKKGFDSHNFMDKLLTKLKMSKHNGNGNGNGKKLKENDTSGLTESKPLIAWEKTKVTPDNIMEFSDQLEQLLDYVQTLKDVIYYTYEYPNQLNDKLEKEAIELRNLFRDVRAAAIDIERLQKQRFIVKKEKCLAVKKLDKLKEEEIRELESIICAYAKPLHSKWETIKNTQKAEVLENFMNEVTGKHRAIEILQELVRRKLAKITKKSTAIPFTLKKNISSTNVNNKTRNQDKTNPNWNLNSFPDIEKFGQSIDKVVRGTPDRDIIRMNRRKRQKELREERRRMNLDNGTTTSNNSENSGGLDLQLVPLESFPSEEAEEVNATKPPVATTTTSIPTRAPPVINIEFTSDDDSVSMSSSDFTIENFVQTGTTETHAELQNEMRSVLQALFGEIRQIPQIGTFSTRNRHNTTTNNTITNSNNNTNNSNNSNSNNNTTNNNNNGNDMRSSRTTTH